MSWMSFSMISSSMASDYGSGVTSFEVHAFPRGGGSKTVQRGVTETTATRRSLKTSTTYEVRGPESIPRTPN